MKIRDYIRLIISELLKRKIILLINIIFLTIAIVLLSEIVHIYHMIGYEGKKIDETIGGKSQTTFHVEFKTLTIDAADYGKRVDAFIKSLGEIEGIDKWGYHYSEWISFEELEGNERAAELAGESNMFMYIDGIANVMHVDTDLLQMCDLTLQEGDYKEYSTYHSQYIPVIAGAGFCDIVSVGDILTVKQTSQKYKIVGIMEEKAQYLAKDGLYMGQIGTMLDNCLMVPAIYYDRETASTFVAQRINNVYFQVGDKKNAGRIKKQVTESGERYDLGINCYSFEELYKVKERENREELEQIQIFVAIMITLAVLGIVCSAIIRIMQNIKSYAIMIACGFSLRTIEKIVVIENMCKVLFAGFLGCAIYYVMTYAYTSNEKMFQIAAEVFWREDIGSIGAVCAGIIVLVSVLPIILLRKKSVSSII